MGVWLVGGGTGGHIVPLTALAVELKERGFKPIVIIDRSKRSHKIAKSPGKIIRLYSGKFRRYKGRNWWERLTDFGTLIANVLDVIKLIIGLIQTLFLMLFFRPKAIFINGGAIGVPVGWVATLLRVPYAIHESDAVTGLANRLISGGATMIMTGFPLQQPKNKTHTTFVGIPLSAEMHDAKKANRSTLQKRYGILDDEPLVVITGGTLGGERFARIIPGLAEQLISLAQIVHIAGSHHVDIVREKTRYLTGRYRALGFVNQTDMANYLALADVVISMAGATTLAELAYFGKPAIIIPNERLTGGHQSKNAELFSSKAAAVVINGLELDQNSNILIQKLKELLQSKHQREVLSKNIRQLSRDDTIGLIVHILTNDGGGESGQKTQG